MKNRNILALLVLSLLSLLTGCQKADKVLSIKQTRDSNIDYVWDKIVEIKIDSTLGIIHSTPNIVGDYLVISDLHPTDYYFHIFDKNNFHFIKSIIHKGHAKGELFQAGFIAPNMDKNEFYLLANQYKFFKINIDSALQNEKYILEQLHDWGKKPPIFCTQYNIINDSTAIAHTMKPQGISEHIDGIGFFNIKTGKISKFSYQHPKASTKRVYCAASAKQNVYVEAYRNRDLITLYNEDGTPALNIYGPEWTENDTSNGLYYYSKVVFVKDKILALYSGKTFGNKDNPEKIIVFNLNGEYLKTLNTQGHLWHNFCYDEDNNRLILTTDEYELAYLPLEHLL